MTDAARVGNLIASFLRAPTLEVIRLAFRRRHLVWLALLFLDVAVLALMTVWVFRRPSRPTVLAPNPAATPTTGGGGSGAPALPVPGRSADARDSRLRGGPKFVACGTVDALGNPWVGSDDQGLWSYQSGDNWLSYGTAEGLADADVTAVACDAAGRMWVGHPDHGLSVYNGQEWRTYDRFAGPAGSHVFCLAATPGDVWIGTDAGLARYSLKGDAWTAYDRSTGLPGAEVTSLAVDSAGRVFAGLDSGGLGLATSADGYATWTHVTGPDDLPIVSSGPGLPSPLVNAVLVTRPNDAVYVGTCHGLARSIDHGATWAYVRGKNWPQLSKGRYDGVPAGFKGTPAGPLLEDWVSALAQDAAGVLWVGYREAGFQAVPRPQRQGRLRRQGSGDGHRPTGRRRTVLGRHLRRRPDPVRDDVRRAAGRGDAGRRHGRDVSHAGPAGDDGGAGRHAGQGSGTAARPRRDRLPRRRLGHAGRLVRPVRPADGDAAGLPRHQRDGRL